ncbi:MAG TPA: D-glycerate dehydrogenase [Candidatus Dormibacteraeota bacterium]|nr:D-glycerate dehydrogenase [Candidatus Dormibacteraeota bacterium]
MVPVALCTLPLPAPGPELLTAAAELRVLGRSPTEEELAEEVYVGVDVLCPQLRDPVTAAVLDAGMPRLRAVSLYSVGYDNVDIAAATERQVVVGHTPGVLTDATADCALGLMLAAARRLCEGDAVTRAGAFHGVEPEFMLGLDLCDALLGIVGFGRIGQALARRALACGMRVAHTEHRGAPPPGDLAGRVTPMPLARLLAESDVVSIHVPLSAATRHLVDVAALRSMKPTAVLVNTARGAIVDEAALVRALREGWIAAAGLDVYENEPRLSPGLVDCRNAVLAPHLGSATVRTRATMARLCAENAVAAIEGRLPPHCVNPEAWAGGPPPPL